MLSVCCSRHCRQVGSPAGTPAGVGIPVGKHGAALAYGDDDEDDILSLESPVVVREVWMVMGFDDRGGG